MISSHRTPPIAIMFPYRGYSASTSLGKQEGVDKESNKKWHAIKKVMSLTQILLSTFYCNSIFIPSWFVMRPCYTEKQKEHIKERSYQCIWNDCIIFAQKYYNSTTLSMWVFYTTCVPKNSLCLCLKMWFFIYFDVMW